MFNKNFIQLIAIIFLTIKTNQLYFYLEQGQEQCFYEMGFKNSVTAVHYHILDSLKNEKTQQKITILLKVYDGKNKLIHEDQINNRLGTKEFPNIVNGEIKLCLTTDSYNWFSENAKLRIEFDYNIITSKVKQPDVNNLVKVEQLEPIYLLNRDIDMQIRELSKQNEGFSDAVYELMSESYNTQENIQTLTICQIVVLVIVALIQIFYIKRFINQKKLF